MVFDTLMLFLNEYFVELNRAKFKFLNQFFNWIFQEKRLLNNFLNWIFLKKNDIELSLELNFTVKWMNESYFESIFAIFDEKSPFLSILDTFWTIFGHFSYSTSIKESLTIELNYLLNWISRIFFELNNILNWILGKAILNRILNESFFGKIQTLNWIRLGIRHH